MTKTTIAKRNDHARMTLCIASRDRLIATAAVADMPFEKRTALFTLVRKYDAFDEAGQADGNDPYGEHDFGTVTLDKEDYFWKIDYFGDPKFSTPAEDPTDPRTYRVLTIMRSSDY